MAMLAEQVDGVIGVDTHRDTLAAAAVSPIGAVLASTDSPANARGYRRLLDFARQQIPAAAAGPWKASAATAPASQPSWTRPASRSSRSAARNERPTAAAARAT
jgi:hypothetical protein